MKRINRWLRVLSLTVLLGMLGMSSPAFAAIQRTCGCNTSVTTTYGSARTKCGVNGVTYTVYATASSQYNFASNSLNDASGLRRLYVCSYNTMERLDSANFGGLFAKHTHPASFGQTMR